LANNYVKESDYNVVLYEVFRVSEQVSVILWSYHQCRYKTFCVCYYQSCCADSVCLCSADFLSGSRI